MQVFLFYAVYTAQDTWPRGYLASLLSALGGLTSFLPIPYAHIPCTSEAAVYPVAARATEVMLTGEYSIIDICSRFYITPLIGYDTMNKGIWSRNGLQKLRVISTQHGA